MVDVITAPTSKQKGLLVEIDKLTRQANVSSSALLLMRRNRNKNNFFLGKCSNHRFEVWFYSRTKTLQEDFYAGKGFRLSDIPTCEGRLYPTSVIDLRDSKLIFNTRLQLIKA